MHRTGTPIDPLPLNHTERHRARMFHQSGTRHPPDSRVSSEFRTSRKLKMDNGKNSRVYRGPEGLDPGLMAYSVSIFFLVPLSHIKSDQVPFPVFESVSPGYRMSLIAISRNHASWICMTPLVGAYCQEIAPVICHKWRCKCSNILIDYHDTLLPLFFVPQGDASSSLLWLSNSRKYCLTHLNFDPRPLLTLLLYIPHSKTWDPVLIPTFDIGSRLRYAVILNIPGILERLWDPNCRV